jgi:fatty acid desaturase
MKLRHLADRRTLCWTLGLCPLLPSMAYVWPALAPWLLAPALGLAYSVGAIAHNHNHVPTFTGRRWNEAFGAWLSFFYGAPLVFWVPTHNLNHHRYKNGPGDATATSRFASRDTWAAALAYPTRSTRAQLPALSDFVRSAKQRSPRLYRRLWLECGAIVLGHALALGFAVALHGAGLGVLTYGLVIGVPALFAPWAMMFTNYVQHVGCDPSSRDHHSRNFTDPTLNWLLFNAGYHTVHHEHPTAHWSRYAELHAQRRAAIGSELQHETLHGYCWQTYARAKRRVPAADAH